MIDVDGKAWERSAKRAQAVSGTSRAVVWLVLVGGVVGFLMPLYIMLAIALKSEAEGATGNIWAWPKQPTLENFRTVLSNPEVSFGLFLKNTAFITAVSTFGVLLSCSVVAYAFARMSFAGRDRLFLVLLSTMMLPGIVTQIPTYVLFAQLRWINTFLPLTVPAFFGSAFNIFLLRQFFMSIPRELDEAAVLDGASHWTIFRRIILPLSGPALATVGVFSIIGAWRDFMGPLLYLNDPDKQTLELGLSTYNSIRSEKWHLLMAGSVLVMIPLLIIFFIGQRYFVRGIVTTGLK